MRRLPILIAAIAFIATIATAETKAPAFGQPAMRPRVFPSRPANPAISISAEAPGAVRLRACLTNLDIPDGATLWVSGAAGIAIAFDRTLAHDGTLWTPSVAGSTITVESDRDARFTIATLVDVPVAARPSCGIDVMCGGDPAAMRVADGIAQYNFISGREAILCTGALIADRAESFAPYFLTANHCAMNAGEAATVEVFWDSRPRSCKGPEPDLDSLPRTNGARLLTASARSDVALLLLSAVPNPRTFLGWTTVRPQEGTLMRRVTAHDYATVRVDERNNRCALFPAETFIHSSSVSGDTVAGDSGAPAFIDDGIITGQLATHCTNIPNSEPCITGNQSIDGAFSTSWEVLAPFLGTTKRRAVRR